MLRRYIRGMAITGVTTCFWFDEVAGEAAEFYVETFPNSRVHSTSYYPVDAQKPAGSVLTVEFELFGQPFLALNAGPHFKHSPAVSFQVFCDTQEEVDRLWDAIVGGGGSESMCGWCADRFGVSWQIIPRRLTELLSSAEPGVAGRATQAMMGMGKIDIAALEAAVA
jgi:predicted 3-demethylubiquinone-9 3-methyltransferase (glyoxalase superfamily)